MNPRKEKPMLDGIEFDSREEVEFYLWCKEAKRYGFIDGFIYHPAPLGLLNPVFIKESRHLKTKVKTVERCLFRAHSYQADFQLTVNPSFEVVLAHGLKGFGIYYIDVKGGFQPSHSREQEFRINQKWVWDKYGIYINKVVPKEFFRRTWAPDIRHKTTGRKLEKYAGFKSVEEVKV